MTATPMSIHTFCEVAPKLPRDTSILLRGPHGIGKSQVVRQVVRKIAEVEGLGELELIDRRLSQMSEGDMIGLPSTDGEVTRFNPPDWFKRACVKPCALFLDELNRATHEVMQAAFQIVLDRELNGMKLHPNSRVFSAINSSAEYTVNEMDPALLDRFWTVDLRPDVKDWIDWATTEGKISNTLVDFIRAHGETWLDTPKKTEPGTVSTSRRSWERLSNAHKLLGIEEEPTNPLFYSISLGYVGTEATIAYVDFAKSVDTRVDGSDVINNWKKFEKKVEKLAQDRLNGLVEKVADYVKKEVGDKLTDKQGKNLQAFMKFLPGELRINAWAKMMEGGVDNVNMAKSIHKYCVPDILDVFGVPFGAAGVNITPNIPGFLKDKDSKKLHNKSFVQLFLVGDSY